MDLKKVNVSRIEKLSKDKNDTIFVKQFTLSNCESSILKEVTELCAKYPIY